MSAGYQNGQAVRAPGDFKVTGNLNASGGLTVPGVTGSEDGLAIHARSGGCRRGQVPEQAERESANRVVDNARPKW